MGFPNAKGSFSGSYSLHLKGNILGLNFLGNASLASLILSNIWPDIMSNCCEVFSSSSTNTPTLLNNRQQLLLWDQYDL